MSKSSFWDHPIEKLEEALHLKKQIHALQEKLSGLFGSEEKDEPASPAAGEVKKGRGGKRVFSAATRAKMAAAQRDRHAAKSGVQTNVSKADTSASLTHKKKRALSPEGRARIIAALKARHAAKRAAQK